MNRLALLPLLLSACWVDNPDYRIPPDLAACPSYVEGGGGGMGRPQVLVPAGTYRIGGMSYTAAAFRLDVFLVTVRAYRECVAAGACKKPVEVGSCTFSDVAGKNEDHPVNCVIWSQAQAFCQWAGRRLPREGEWQYAAAGMKSSGYPWGDDLPQTNADGGSSTQLCWSGSSTCPVGSYGRTLLGGSTCNGVADLSGNVWEWTASEYHDPYVSPEPACNEHSVACSMRGGSWGNDDPAFFGTTYRYSFDPSFGLVNFGFRCAR